MNEQFKSIAQYLADNNLSIQDLVKLLSEYQAYTETVDAITVRLQGRHQNNQYLVDVLLLDVENYKPVTSFQMELAMDADEDGDRARFLGVQKGYLTEVGGWTVASSSRTHRVGGFTSALGAIRKSGVLCTLIFDQPDEIEFKNFRLFGILSSGPDGVRSGFLNHEPKLLIHRA